MSLNKRTFKIHKKIKSSSKFIVMSLDNSVSSPKDSLKRDVSVVETGESSPDSHGLGEEIPDVNPPFRSTKVVTRQSLDC